MNLQQAKDEAWQTIRADTKVIQQVTNLLDKVYDEFYIEISKLQHQLAQTRKENV